MRSLGDLRFPDFPAGDDLWWLTWFDYHSPSTMTRSSMLQVTFARLPGVSTDNLPVLDDALARQARGLRTVLLQSGWLPVLSIGLVVLAGRVVGQLGANILSFVFDRKMHTARIEPMRLSVTPSQEILIRSGRVRRARALIENLSDEDLPGGRPLWAGPSSHPMLDVTGGRMLSIGGESRGSPVRLLLPCPEVARLMYAPHRALAAALLDDGWHSAKADVLDLERTRVLEDGSWEIAARVPLADEHLAVAGNMLFNRLASRRANLLRYWITSEPNGGRLSANLPFDWDRLELTVACFPVPLPGLGSWKAWFGHEIVGVRWPDPPLGPPRQIHVPAHANAQGDERLPSDDRGFPARTKAPPPGGGPVDATQVSDPGAGSEPTAVEVEGPTWTNAPAIVRARKEVSHVREARPPTPPPDPAVDLSAGQPTPRAVGPAPADPMAMDRIGGSQPASPMFERVLGMLTELAKGPCIASHAAVPWPRNPRLCRGDVPVWPLPPIPSRTGEGTRRWYVRDFAGPPGKREVRRAAMVREIATGSGTAYWLEIERRRPAESCHSLVFTVQDAADLAAVVSRLLAVAAENEGVWPEVTALSDASSKSAYTPGILRAGLWRHVAVRNLPSPPGEPREGNAGPAANLPLSGAEAFVRIRTVTTGSGPGSGK